MRTAVVAREHAIESASRRVLDEGGNAVDAALAGMLVGAVRASPASLLGSGVVLVAGTGMGAHIVEGFARAPGLRARRPTVNASPPASWSAVVPGLLEGVLAAHQRFGSRGLGPITAAAVASLRDGSPDAGVVARAVVVDGLARTGIHTLEQLGITHDVLECASAAADGVFTRDDLAPFTPTVCELTALNVAGQQVFRALEPPEPPYNPPRLPRTPIDAVVCADSRGTLAAALWLVAPEAIALPGASGLSLAALSNAPARGVPRRRPGSTLPFAVPAAVLAAQGRAWAALAVSGRGDTDAALMRAIGLRLALEQGAYGRAPRDFAGAVLWAIRDPQGPDVRAHIEEFGGR